MGHGLPRRAEPLKPLLQHHAEEDLRHCIGQGSVLRQQSFALSEQIANYQTCVRLHRRLQSRIVQDGGLRHLRLRAPCLRGMSATVERHLLQPPAVQQVLHMALRPHEDLFS